MSSAELSEWKAYWKIKAQEIKDASSGSGGGGGSQDFPGPDGAGW